MAPPPQQNRTPRSPARRLPHLRSAGCRAPHRAAHRRSPSPPPPSLNTYPPCSAPHRPRPRRGPVRAAPRPSAPSRPAPPRCRSRCAPPAALLGFAARSRGGELAGGGRGERRQARGNPWDLAGCHRRDGDIPLNIAATFKVSLRSCVYRRHRFNALA